MVGEPVQVSPPSAQGLGLKVLRPLFDHQANKEDSISGLTSFETKDSQRLPCKPVEAIS